MRKTVLIFPYGYRPMDHFRGLLIATSHEAEMNIVVVVPSVNFLEELNIEIKLSDNVKLVCRPNLFYLFWLIVRASVIFGSLNTTSKFFVRFTAFFKKSLAVIDLLPGKITKAMGSYKTGRIRFISVIEKYVSTILFNKTILVSDDFDRVYTASAFGYPLNMLSVNCLPKHIYINSALSEKARNLTKGILFAPTHRWDGIPSPIETLLEDEEFSFSLKSAGFNLFLSTHYQSKYNGSVNLNYVNKFVSKWDLIDIVVTDYSSIGADFILSGGKTVIYYISDIKEFEEHEGKGPFFNFEVSNNIASHNRDELFGLLIDFKTSKIENVKCFDNTNYFSSLLTSLNL